MIRVAWPPCSMALSLAVICAVPSAGAGGWIEAGDDRLRNDVQLLADSGLLPIPLSTWPLPASDLQVALDALPSDRPLSASESSAINRLRARVGAQPSAEYTVRAGSPGKLRVFDTQGREEAELTGRFSSGGRRWAADLQISAVTSARDGQTFRLDGSHATVFVGNWTLSASMQERFWGPGHEGSLLLGNDARPFPALVFDRATTAPSDWRWLSWIGHWRLTGLLGRLDGGRDDVDQPLFFGMRFTMRPVDWLEIGASRTAQFCGDARRCGLQTFFDMFTGRDNVGFQGIDASEDQPGNQLAGFDVRLRSPWRRLPVAVYVQDIGEDQVDLRPTDRMHLYGLETWLALRGGSVLRGYAEYADTSCGANDSPPLFDCAYTNNVYFADGYRYRGRAIGHTTDADSESRAVSLVLVRPDGQQWRARVRNASLNRGVGIDRNHSQSVGPAKLESAELGFRSSLLGGDWDVQLGVERLRPQSSKARDSAFGMLTWRRTFD